MNTELRVSYNMPSLGLKWGVGTVRLLDSGIDLIDKDGNSTHFAKSETDINIGGMRGELNMGPHHTFKLTQKGTKKRYLISFIGSDEKAVLGIAQDWKEHQKIFIQYVAALQGENSNFKSDGTYRHSWKGYDSSARKNTVILPGLLILFAIIFIVLVYTN